MRFVMCGAGAIGGVLGGQLAKAGCEVILIDKLPEHVKAINTHGLQLKGVHGNHTLNIPAVLQAREVDFRPDDVIFLAMKSFHCDAAVVELRRATTLELPIFCAQNGVANEGIAARYFQNVNGLIVLIGAKRLVPGEVVPGPDHQLLVAARLRAPSPLLQAGEVLQRPFEEDVVPAVEVQRRHGDPSW